MTDDDPHLIEFINNLSAELTARRDMVLDRVNNQLQSLLESFDSVTGGYGSNNSNSKQQ